MSKLFRKRVLALLLTVTLLVGSPPEVGMYVHAAKPVETEEIFKNENETQKEENSVNQNETEKEETSESQSEAQKEENSVNQSEETESDDETRTEEISQEQSETEIQTVEETRTENETSVETETEMTSAFETETETTSAFETETEMTSALETETETTSVLETEMATEIFELGEENADYPIDTTKYTLTDVTMEPDKYSAAFSANCTTAENSILVFYVIYTTDRQAAEDFFKEKRSVTFEELRNSDIKRAALSDWKTEKKSDTPNEYSLQGTFGKSQYLEPNTTYHYRIAYETIDSGIGYTFLTALDSFTTLEQQSAIEFTDFKTEIMDYNKVKVSWTVYNPNSESIKAGPYLYYANEEEEYSNSKNPSQYRDEENKVVPNKYYYEISPTKGKKLKVKLELEVAITDDDSKPHPSSFKICEEFFDVEPYIPPVTSAVSIKDVLVEDITYNKLKVVWTVENPNNEYFTGSPAARPYLYYANEGEEYSQNSNYNMGRDYKDEQDNIVPNKYYYEISTKGKTLKAKVGVKVFRGETEEEITSEEISITPYIPPEISAVTMKDFQVEKIGYNKAKIIWTVDNPEKETITENEKLYYIENGSERCVYRQEYKNEAGQTVPDKYYCEIQTKGESLKAYLQWKVFRGENNETFKTEEIEISPYNISNAVEVKMSHSTISSQATVTIDPWYEIDSGDLVAYVYYREKNSAEWKNKKKSLSQAVEMISLDTLSPQTEYEYYIQILAGYNSNCIWNDGSAENPKTFTTKEITTYSDQDFPDAVFRSCVKKALILSDNAPITSDKLETLTRLDYPRSSSDITGNIKSIEGIQYIENLTYINFSGHVITDASMIENLTNLTDINMSNNDLAELPNLSRMNNLSNYFVYFNYNKIVSDSFRAEKLPAAFLEKNPEWLSKTAQNQRGDYNFITAPKYYAIGEKHPFIIKVKGLKSDSRKYTLTAAIDGVDVSLKSDNSESEKLFYIEDISTVEGFSVALGKEYTISSITLTDTYGNQYKENQSYSFIFAEDEPYAEKKYIDTSQNKVSVKVEMPGTIEKNDIESIVMQDPSGNEIGRSNIDDLRAYPNNRSENRYKNIFDNININSLKRQITDMSSDISFSKYLSAGEYNVVITMKDGKAYCLENVVEVIGKDIVWISSLSLTSNSEGYDNYGDYLHVKLYGTNLDPDKIWPVFYKEETVITELVNAEWYFNNNSPSILYTLKKLDKDIYWQQTGNSFTWYDYRLEADKDYPFIDNIGGTHKIALNNINYNRNCILFEHYNYKKDIYEVTVDSAVLDGQKMFVSLYEDEEHTKLKATAEGIVESSQLLLKFKDTEGKDYAPPRNQYAYFIYEYRDNTNQKLGEFTNKKYVQWYCYYEKNNISNYTTMYQRSGLKELELKVGRPADEVTDKTKTIEASVYASNGSEKGSSVTLTPETIGNTIRYTGNWQSAQGLSEGIYTVKYTQEGVVLYSTSLYVYDNSKFYMNYQELGKDAEGTYIRITSEQLGGEYIHEYQRSVSNEQALEIWNENYTLNIYDKLHNEITGWTVKSAKWDTSSFYIYLENLSEEYIGYYMRISHKTKGLGEKLGTGKSYYSGANQSNETYGEWETISSSWNDWLTSSKDNCYIGFSAKISEVFPVTVTIMKPSGTEIVNRFIVSLPESINGSYPYYFTSGDILGTESDEVYRVVLSGAEGSSTDTTCYLGTNDQTTGDTKPATGIRLDKTTVNLSVGQSVTLKASIEPENATNQYLRWTNSRPNVAKIDKTTGKVTALQSGKTTITVYTHNNKKAECIVIVSESNYHISETELTFDLSEGAEQSKTLTVYEGNTPVSGVTWSSDNETIVTVTKKEDGSGTVTPIGVGTTQIKAVLSDKTELSCLVTVTASVTDISLNKSVLNLRINQTEKLTATITPENAVDQTITWSSSNPKVASVDNVGNVTALTLGTTVITVTTSNKRTAECSVTVSNYEISQSELTFQLGKGNPKTAVLSVKSDDTLVKDVIWSSDNEVVATVAKKEDGSAEVTAVSAGTAKIAAKMPDGTILYCAVSVMADATTPEYPVTNIILDKTSLLLFEGQSEQLTAKILPENATDKSITWSSSDLNIATVDHTGKVTAVSIGEVVVTAVTSNHITASCTVRVILEKPELVALTNVQKTLADVILPEGWSWIYPDIALDQFAGAQKKSFAAIYQPDKDKEPYRTSLKVQLTKVNNISIALENQSNGTEKGFSMRKDTKATLYVQFRDANQRVVDNTLVAPYLDDIQWSSTKEAVADVKKDASGVILSANGEGKTNIKAQITLGSKVYKTQYAVTVVDGEIAEISVLSIDKFMVEENDTEKNLFSYYAKDTLGTVDSTIQATMTNATKLTAKSSNPGVAAVGKVVNTEGNYQIPLTVKSAGTTKVTLTANDKAKTSKDIWLRISDPTPNLSESTITINTLQTTGTAISVYANQGYTISNVMLSGPSQFTIEKDTTEADQYLMKAANGVEKGNYKAEITATVNDNTYTMPLTIKVVNQTPACKVKQKAKVNLFHKNPKALLDITTDEIVEEIALTGCDFTVEKLDGNYYIAAKEGITTNCNKNGELQITLAGYKTFSMRYTVSIENKALKLSLSGKTMTLYPNVGIVNAHIAVLDNKATLDLESVSAELESTERCSLVKEGNEIILTAKDLSKAATFKEKIILKSENWSKDIVLPCTVKVNMGKPSVKLQTATLQLNKNKDVYSSKESVINSMAAVATVLSGVTETAQEGYAQDAAATTVMWKDAFSFTPQEISVTAGNAKAQALIDNNVVSFETIENKVIAKLNSTEATNGSYRFIVNVKANEDCIVTAPLTVKIVDVAAQKAVKVSMKGSIDLMNRSGSFVTATPSLKSVNGTIIDIGLTGRAAHLFRTVYDKDKVYIYAKEDEALITKYNYSVALKITLRNAQGKIIQITSPMMKLKLKQSKVKIMAAPKSAVFFSGAYNSVKVHMKASLNGAPNPIITNVELINNTNAFSYRFSEGRLTLQSTGEAVKGKTYSLQFRVTLNGQADNEKVMVVKYQVRVR